MLKVAGVDRRVVLDTLDIDGKTLAFWKHQGFEEIDYVDAVDLVGDHAREEAFTLSGYY